MYGLLTRPNGPGSTRRGLTRLVRFRQEKSSIVFICGILRQLIIAIVSELGCQHCVCFFAVLCTLSVLGALHAHALLRLSLPVWGAQLTCLDQALHL